MDGTGGRLTCLNALAQIAPEAAISSLSAALLRTRIEWTRGRGEVVVIPREMPAFSAGSNFILR